MRSLILPLAQNASRLAFIGARSISSSRSLTSLEIDDTTGIAILTMNRPPVNGLNLDLLTELKNSVDQLERNKCRGMILTSSSKTVFTGGLDIHEIYKPNQDRLKNYWATLQDVWLKLYGSSFPTAAAINGHSPAGGCLLALCCEYRVMCPNYTIGFNETQLGIVAPKFCIASMKNVVSTRIAEQALTLGRLFSTDEALKIGLIDEIATDKGDAVAKCEEFLMKFKKISPVARGLTKQACRSKDIQELEENRDMDLQININFYNQPKIQKSLETYLESLKKKKK